MNVIILVLHVMDLMKTIVLVVLVMQLNQGIHVLAILHTELKIMFVLHLVQVEILMTLF